MDFKNTVVPRDDRRVRFEQEKQTPIRHEPYTFRSKPTLLPVVRIPNEYLVYRMNNGRTRLKQAEYTVKHSLPPDYFLKSEEDASAQQLQHKILLELARDSRGPIYQELAYKASQTESLLVTSTGVVVNGNRRLAAMRHLLANDSTGAFAAFNHLDVAILPPEATLEDIEEIESELQEIPETKLEYDWISRRLKLRYRRDVLKMSAEKLVKMYRFKSKEDINRELQQLELAEDYLERYAKRPGEYELVEQSEEVIRQLQAAIDGRTPEMAEMGRLIAFPLIKEARELGTRAYEFRYAFGADAEEVLNRYATHKDIGIGDVEDEALPNEESEDPLLGFERPSRYADLKNALLDGGKSKEVAADLVRIATAIREEKKEGGRKQAALKKAEAANRAVHELDLNGADPATFPMIIAQLDSCIVRADKVRQDIRAKMGRK